MAASASEREHARRYPRSEEWELHARATDAWATARPPVSSIPRYFSRARGAHVWDLDGNRYVDYILGFGHVVLGHADPRVTGAVTEELERGTCVAPIWSPRQAELTELLATIVPGAEAAYLMRTGSDATSGAVRLARIFTGRSKVARWGYTGWHDWAARRPEGVHPAVRDETLSFDYNGPGSLLALFEAHPDEIACVIMMPFELDAPDPGFLHEVQALARHHGALFVLDEMRSGFRMALGGAQEFFGLAPDLSTFGKAMANGHPISAITGRSDVLACLGRTHMASTTYSNAPEMAAALATIAVLRDSDAIPRLWRLGEALVEGLRAAVDEHGLPAEVVGYPIAPFLRFDPAVEGAKNVKARFFAETSRRGVLFAPNHQWFVSAAHTDEDLELTVEACRRAAAFAAAG